MSPSLSLPFTFNSIFYFSVVCFDLVIAQIILINPENNCGHLNELLQRPLTIFRIVGALENIDSI